MALLAVPRHASLRRRPGPPTTVEVPVFPVRATGRLRLDGFGNVERTPAWATFSGGHVVPLGGG